MPDNGTGAFLTNMDRFIQCASDGAHATASTGELACFKLACRVREIADLLGSIDAGLKEEFFDVLAASAWPDTRSATLRIIDKITNQ